jgi:hypothetical protein
MDNRFSPAPNSSPQQPADALADQQVANADLLPLLGRFAAIALAVTLVFVIGFRVIGFNKVRPQDSVESVAGRMPAPLVSTPSPYVQSTVRAAATGSPTAPATGTYAPSNRDSQFVPTVTYTYVAGTELVRLEDGRFNEAVRQWYGRQPPRAVVDAPVDGVPSPAPFPRFLPAPASTSSEL